MCVCVRERESTRDLKKNQEFEWPFVEEFIYIFMHRCLGKIRLIQKSQRKG